MKWPARKAVLKFKSARDRREPELMRRGLNLADVLAALNAVFTLALAIFAYEAWEESRRATAIFQGQLSAAQDQLTAARDAQRAWLTVEANIPSVFSKVTSSKVGGFTVPFHGYQLPITYKTKNVGHMPAQAVLIGTSYVIPRVADNLPIQQLLAEQKQACTRPPPGKVVDAFSASIRGATIFPDDQVSESSDEIAIPVRDWPTAPFASDNYLFLVGCVMYRSADEQREHHTAFAYRLADSNDRTFAFPTDPTTIELPNVRLSRLRFSDLLSAD